MLKSMRKHAKYFYFLFFLIILTFVFWGVGVNNKNQTKPLAVIDGQRISTEDYYRAVDRMDDVYRNAYGSKYDEKMRGDVRKQVLDNMIQEYVLAQAAVHSGLTATDAEVQQDITSDTKFQENGAFSPRLYRRLLSYNRTTPANYEASVRRSILVDKLRTLIEDAVFVSDDDLKKISGDPKVTETLKQTIIDQKKREAMSSYVNGLMRTMNVTINRDLVAS